MHVVQAAEITSFTLDTRVPHLFLAIDEETDMVMTILTNYPRKEFDEVAEPQDVEGPQRYLWKTERPRWHLDRDQYSWSLDWDRPFVV